MGNGVLRWALGALVAAGLFARADDAPGTVCCREEVVSLREGWEDFFLPWKQQVALACTNGVLGVSGRQRDVFIMCKKTPGPKPVRGPGSIRLVTEGTCGGEVALALKHLDTGKIVTCRQPWTRETRFVFDLPHGEAWQFERLSFFPGRTVRHDFSIRALEAEVRCPPAQALRLDVDTHSPLHVTHQPLAHPPVLTLANEAACPLAFSARVTLENYFGERLQKVLSGRLAPGATLHAPVDLRAAASNGCVRLYGIWRVRAVISCASSVATNETRFAVLNPHAVTPRTPRGTFRMGINYHMARCTPAHERLTLDALNACGAKLVRAGGFSASACWTAKDRLDFSKADARMARLKERGLSLNCGCWPNAEWMASEEALKHPYPYWIRTRAKKGVMGEYAEKLAAHFGTDIDYIETSNEADLWPTNAMSAAQYIDYQKEVYAGVKRGCKDIKVLTSAWAAADSSGPMCRRKGYQEAVLVGAKGHYDIHPTHQHSGFSAYENDMLAKFFPLRARAGVTVPWYANETALTSVNGAEDGVALALWQKILWSWAHGSVDYIWYNLRATGWRPGDPEQGYGLITADFYPRAGFAAFSSLAYALGGFACLPIVHEGKGRYLYAFAGMRSGKPCRAFAGWDRFTDPPHEIRVETDASGALLHDIMGNVRAAPAVAGGFVFPISKTPGVLVLHGATRAACRAEDVATIPAPNIKARALPSRVEGRRPDWHLFKWWHVRELYAANPETVARTWQGPEDLSVRIWLGCEKDDLRVRFVVRDDTHVQRAEAAALYKNDGLQFVLEAPGQDGNFEFGLARTADDRPLVHTWIVPRGFDAERVARSVRLAVSRTKDQTLYDAHIPLAALGFTHETLETGFRFNAIVYDDDGLGDARDGWMEIVPGIAGKKEYTQAPFVKIVRDGK